MPGLLKEIRIAKASDCDVGGLLTDTGEGERVVVYGSRTLIGAEKIYSATEKGCLAIILGKLGK